MNYAFFFAFSNGDLMVLWFFFAFLMVFFGFFNGFLAGLAGNSLIFGILRGPGLGGEGGGTDEKSLESPIKKRSESCNKCKKSFKNH